MYPELLQLGLTKRETSAYLALCEVNEATVTELSKMTTQHRVNMYDTLNSLSKKGLIEKSKKNGVAYYSLKDVEKLISFIDNKRELALSILPALKKKHQVPTSNFSFELFETWTGFRSLLAELSKKKGELLIIGDRNHWYKLGLDLYYKKFQKERERNRVFARILNIDNDIEYGKKDVVKKLKLGGENSTIMIVGDYVGTFIWSKPLNATLVRSEELANSYRNYFEMLWQSK